MEHGQRREVQLEEAHRLGHARPLVHEGCGFEQDDTVPPIRPS
jgi:hypothetical protein